MSVFKPKRVSGVELAGQLAGATAHLPISAPHTAVKPLKKVQINFQASEQLAELVAREAEKAGSTRRFFARLLRQAGYNVPEADVNPPDTRRRRGIGG
jgi:hypothetical protein